MMGKKIPDEINRINSQNSTGPKAPEGKQRSAMNLFKLAQRIIDSA
jgi:hypothetical protein